METHSLDSLEEQPGEVSNALPYGVPNDVPEDVAILHSWANMEGATYRDFSASRREYRAQMRHRAAEHLRQMELQAQAEAEAAASQAEEAAALAHARAEEAAARLPAKQAPRSGSRSFNGTEHADLTPDSREEQERLKAVSLRSAVQQARKAAMEREEASKRARAAAFAESIARREEQEIAEARASAIRQAAQYAEAGGQPRRSWGSALEEWIPGEISDPYARPSINAEEDYDLPHPQEERPGATFVPHAQELPVLTPQVLQTRHEVFSQPTEARYSTDNQSLQRDFAAKPSAISEIQAHAHAEVVYRLAPEATLNSTVKFGPEPPAVTPAAVRTLVSEFSPVEAMWDAPPAQVVDENPSPTQTIENPIPPPPAAKTESEVALPQAPQHDHPAPAWLYPSPQKEPARENPRPDAAPPAAGGSELFGRSKERIATKWFGLRRLFGTRDPNSEHDQEPVREEARQAPIVAILSIAGGVGKTSLVATLGCALSRLGERVLLGDTGPHSLLPYYFGSTKRLPSVLRMFCPPPEASGMPVHLLNCNAVSDGESLDGQTKAIELLLTNSLGSNRLLLDLSFSDQGIVERLRNFQPTILVPLVADMNSVLSIQTLETMFHAMADAEGRALRPTYLLNQFDATLPLQLDIREILKHQLGDRLLPFVIRRSPAVSEALAEGMTIVDYDPEAAVVQDYLRVANWLRTVSASNETAPRKRRWSEP